MKIEQLFWAAVLVVVAVAIAMLNDRSKPKNESHAPRTNSEQSPVVIILGTFCVLAIVGLAAYFGVSDKLWLVPFIFGVFVFLTLVYALRNVIWILTKHLISTGKLPAIATRTFDGQIQIKCPTCSSTIGISAVEPGGSAFECTGCGERGTWISK